ncbi:SusC/RagA family TonB-linked outer membrane protein [Lacinutrix sp. Bg11-31]|uniref:SusC/RagA family TonB-linked outer membrane protein n=1 Tax=Lacinutrix sp. Bg11-31 TaxID=2057808 RepID=UPI000C309FA2|nr:SusC/RagA family TonB-linked outer membrane protein [Lacinutrix sp. Bg11-31]AUC82343.1 SusC/RagA family TonB-linked outer membrane protein [Lacinutrix sp. Bg11-31]
MKTKFSGILTLLLAFVVQLSFAQGKTISGTISDGDNLPLPGVNVVVKGTSNGTTTDFDGNYSISANTGDVLVFSFVGNNEEKTVGANNKISFTMLENQLEEVVITALGIKKAEKAIGYSVQKVSGDGLTEAREGNLVNALSGKAAGIQVTNSSGSVGASSRIVLRGNSTITGNNQPLFVVDGVPLDNSSYSSAGSGGGRDLPNGAADINPDDIESISVLKGPNAAALYGVRGANGVIVITTKSGGNKDGSFSVNINSNATFSNPLKLPSYQNSYGQGGDTNYFEFVDGASGGIGDGVDESWGPALDVGLEFVQWNSQLNGGQALPWVSNPDNVKDFFDTGVALSNSISVTKGGQGGSMRFSLGKSEQDGMVPFTELNRLNLGFNGKMDLGKKFHGGMSMSYINSESDNLPTGGYNNENPMQQFIWSARQVNFSDLRDWRNFPLAPSNTAAAGTPLNWNHNFQNNPYWILENNRNTFAKNRYVGNIYFTYDFSDKFSATAKYSRDQYAQAESIIKAKGSNESPDGAYTEVKRDYTEANIELLLSYNTDLSDDFTLSLNAGTNGMKRNYSSLIGSAPGLELPGLYNLSNILTGATPTYSNYSSERRINSVYGFGSIGYNDYLFLEFSGRNDWASVLPVANNSFFYPSVSLSAIVSDMVELDGAKIDYLKLRGGWSKVGSTGALGPYNLNQTYGLSNNAFGNQASTPNTRFSNTLTPETVTGYEAGIDVRMFNSKIKFSATYYNQLSTDLLLPIQLSASTGVTSAWKNAGEMENKGIELSLGATVIENDNFKLGVDFNWAKNKNEVVSLGGLDSYILGSQWGVRLEARPGQPYGVLVGRGFERNDSGQVIYENGLPKIDDTYKVLGDIAPDWTGGVSLNMQYKGFTLNTLVDAKIGGDVHSMSYAWGRYAGTLEETLEGRETGVVGNGVMSDGSGGYVQNNVVTTAKLFNQNAFGNGVEESAIFDASYVKLRSVSIGYSLPQSLLKGTFISNAKFAVVGRNLAILHSNVPHIDPETGFSSGNGEQGQEFGQIPSARSIGFNVNLSF